MNNQLLVRILYGNKLATREQIQEQWGRLTPDTDIARLLVDAGVLDAAVYPQVIQFAQDLESGQTPAQAKEPEASAPATVSAIPFPPYPEDPKAATAVSGADFVIESTRIQESMPAVAVERLSLVQSTQVKDPESRPSWAPRNSGLLDAGEGELRPLPESFPEDMELPDLLTAARHWGADDVHISAGRPVHMRRAGHLVRIDGPVPSSQRIQDWKKILMDSASFSQTTSEPFCLGLPGLGRVRFTYTGSEGREGVHCRLISGMLPAWQELGLPDAALDLSAPGPGLVFLSGAAGSGRTRAALALARAAGEKSRGRILYIGTPVEFLPQQMRASCTFTAVECRQGRDSVADLLRNYFSMGFDIVVVDSVQTPEDIAVLLRYAAAGRQVFAVSMGVGVVSTLYGILDSAHGMGTLDDARELLASTLRGMLSFLPVPRKDGMGQVLAVELLKASATIANLVRKGDLAQIPASMGSGGKNSGLTFDESLEKLVQAGTIDTNDAILLAADPRRFSNRGRTK